MKHEISSYNTKKKIANALREAMVEKPFKEVSVAEIARRSGINRKTFYYHFSSTNELLKWILQDEIISEVSKIDFVTNYLDVVNFIIDYIEQNASFIHSLVESGNISTIGHFLRSNISELYLRSASRLELGSLRGEFSDDAEYQKMRQFITTINTEATIGAITYWIEHPGDYTREEMVKFIDIYMRLIIARIN